MCKELLTREITNRDKKIYKITLMQLRGGTEEMLGGWEGQGPG